MNSKSLNYTISLLNQNRISFYNMRWTNDKNSLNHTHVDFYEIFIATSSDFEHVFNGTRRKLPKNTLFFLPPGTTHQIISKKTTDSPLYFNIDIARAYFDNFFCSFTNLLPTCNINKPFSFILEQECYDYLCYIASRLTTLSTKETDKTFLINNFILNVFFFYSI